MQGMRFNFTGKLSLNSMESKNPWLRKGDNYKVVSCAIAKDANNRAYAEMYGGKPANGYINSVDEDGNKIQIKWETRNDEGVINKVAKYAKTVVDIGDERKEFIAAYDAVNYLAEHLEDLKGSMVTITGDVSKDFYNGKVRDRYRYKNFYVVKEDAVPKLNIAADMFWRYEDFDLSAWKTDKKIYLNAFTNEFVNKEVGRKFIQSTFIIDGSQYNFEDEMDVKKFKCVIADFGLAYDNDIVTRKGLKNNQVYTIRATAALSSGAEEVKTVKYEDLPQKIKDKIDCGLITLDDYVKDVSKDAKTYGAKKVEMKIAKIDMNDYADGCIVAPYTLDEFENDIYVAPDVESEREAVAKAMEDGDDDMFD